MNPESRVKLIRSLEEIKIFEQNNYASKTKNFYKWGTMVIYCVVALFAYRSELKRNVFLAAFMIIPTVAYSLWLSFRNTLDERHKLLANAVLELGSIAQTEEIKESVIEKSIFHKTAAKKRISKRKK